MVRRSGSATLRLRVKSNSSIGMPSPRHLRPAPTVSAFTTPTASREVLYFGGWSTPNAATEDRLAAAFGPESGVTAEILGDAPRFVAHLDRNGDGGLQIEEVPGVARGI